MANKRRLKGKRDRTHSCTGKNRKIKEVKRAPAKSTTRVGVDKPNTFMADLFAPSDDVLLVGEGDLSFSCALVRHFYPQHVRSVHATTFDDRDALLNKYPHASANTEMLEGSSMKVSYGIDARKLDQSKRVRSIPFSTLNYTPSRTESNDEEEESSAVETVFSSSPGQDKRHKNEFPGYTKIVFNFPHTGGLSSSVRHQTRHNQALIVDFFNSAKKVIRPKEGKIVVTLFNGQPYDMWGIRDLARHCGLVVERSGVFDSTEWAKRGYQHARTMGNVVSKDGKKDCEGYWIDGREDEETEEWQGISNDDDENERTKPATKKASNILADQQNDSKAKRPGAWRGEERPARTYVFGFPQTPAHTSSGKRKRTDHTGSSSDSNEFH